SSPSGSGGSPSNSGQPGGSGGSPSNSGQPGGSGGSPSNSGSPSSPSGSGGSPSNSGQPGGSPSSPSGSGGSPSNPGQSGGSPSIPSGSGNSPGGSGIPECKPVIIYRVPPRRKKNNYIILPELTITERFGRGRELSGERGEKDYRSRISLCPCGVKGTEKLRKNDQPSRQVKGR
ncbi:jg23296, partial [Pararge aegeria aegeria]